MDDEQLERALGELNRRLTVSPAGDPRRTADCLTFFRARAVVLDPLRESAQEAAHLAGCRRCRQLIAGFARHLPHLSMWTLIRHQLGAVLPAEREQLDYHLLHGRCRECAGRAERLAQSPLALLQLPPPAPLLDPAVARAAVPESEVLVQGQNGDLEADLVRDGAELCLEVRTRNPAYWRQLVAYVFESATGDVLLEGYLVLGADVEGWCTAQDSIDPDWFRAKMPSACRSLQIAMVQPAYLSAEEWSRVEAAAPEPDASAGASADWLEFCRRSLADAGALSGAAVAALSAISSKLTGDARRTETRNDDPPE